MEVECVSLLSSPRARARAGEWWKSAKCPSPVLAYFARCIRSTTHALSRSRPQSNQYSVASPRFRALLVTLLLLHRIPSQIRKSNLLLLSGTVHLSLSTTPPPPPGQLTRLPFFALHRGFGFVTFRDSTVVSKVLADESSHVLDNKRVSENERRKKPRGVLVAPPPFHPRFAAPRLHKQTTLRAILFVLAVDRSESGRRSRNEQRF